MPTELPALPRRLDLAPQLGKQPSAGNGRQTLGHWRMPAARRPRSPDSATIAVYAKCCKASGAAAGCGMRSCEAGFDVALGLARIFGSALILALARAARASLVGAGFPACAARSRGTLVRPFRPR